MKYNVLLADDDASIRFVLSKYLTRAGYGVKATDNPQTLQKWVAAGEGDVVLTDVHMGTEEIFSYIPRLKTLRPELPIIVISANTRMATALKSRKTGVFAYIPKPFDLPDLEATIKRALDMGTSQQPHIPKIPDQMIGRSKAMQPVFRAISDYASGSVPIFIWGDVGTGKNLAARCVHDAGTRSDLAFFRFDRFEMNDPQLGELGSGDLFVDRVHELNAERQACLLELLEHNERRTAAEKFRVIATADTALEVIQQDKLLRTDLLSHLMGGQIFLPALSEREDDLADLAAHFLNLVRPGVQGQVDIAALVRLKAHTWPGNVRELRNLIHVGALQSTGATITVDIVERMLAPNKQTSSVQENPFSDIKLACADLLHRASSGQMADKDSSTYSPFETALEWVEKPLIVEALRLTGGNNSKAADLLGIHRNTLRTKLRKWQQ